MNADLALRLGLAVAALPGSATEVAERLGVHRSTVYRWTRGSAEPDAGQMAGLAAAVGVPVGVLHYGPTPVLRSLLGEVKRGN